uniref:Ribosomal protein S10 n=1 Tax=Cymbomonas tetramitiformis TaxID=36881 RepID=A0A1S5R1Z2_9CHLO|nr:ribosomal protein S10 [Cymbomonas tetramitiformis]ANA57097.1 ribosomal protein S10 [Cymbomonas tetramitiformis]
MFNSIIIIKSFEKDYVFEVCRKLRGKAARLASIPTHCKRFTVLRSPHVFKKSREQFEMKTYKSLITQKYSSCSQLKNAIQKVVHMDKYGVQTKIKLQFSSWFLYKKK